MQYFVLNFAVRVECGSQSIPVSAKCVYLLVVVTLRQLRPNLTKDQLEDVVVDKVVVAVLGQVEDLGEVHGPLLLVDLQLAGDEDNDAVGDGGLRVEGGRDVLDTLEGEVLNVLATSEELYIAILVAGKDLP